MNEVLFLNTFVKQCGVYQYGIRVYDIIKHSDIYAYKYYEIESVADYCNALLNHPTCVAVIYNYHSTPMSWLNPSCIQKRVKNIGIIHESDSYLFDIVVTPDPSVETYGLPRPIYNSFSLSSYEPSTAIIGDFIDIGKSGSAPVIGSFGFGFLNKGFHHIISYVNTHYDDAIIKFVIPMAHYSNNHMYQSAIAACHSIITKPGIQLHITNEFLSNEDILAFLSSNTVNLFLYDYMYGRGISSALDYAISVNRPFAISGSFMFRHIYKDDICLDKNTIDHCIAHSLQYLPELKEKYSHSNMIKRMDSIITANCG